VRDSEELELSLSINNAAVRCDKIRVKVPLRGGHQPPLPVEVTVVLVFGTKMALNFFLPLSGSIGFSLSLDFPSCK
jgi:hypothetical protein